MQALERRYVRYVNDRQRRTGAPQSRLRHPDSLITMRPAAIALAGQLGWRSPHHRSLVLAAMTADKTDSITHQTHRATLPREFNERVVSDRLAGTTSS
jgi:hypothetical protein